MKRGRVKLNPPPQKKLPPKNPPLLELSTAFVTENLVYQRFRWVALSLLLQLLSLTFKVPETKQVTPPMCLKT